MTRFVFVTGGVVSSLGKGIAAASLGAILESRGMRVTMLKLDPETRDIPVLTYTTECEGQDFDEAISQLAEEEGELLPSAPVLRMN